MTVTVNIGWETSINATANGIAYGVIFYASGKNIPTVEATRNFTITGSTTDIPTNKFDTLENALANKLPGVWTEILDALNNDVNLSETYVEGVVVSYRFPAQLKIEQIDSSIATLDTSVGALQTAVTALENGTTFALASHNHDSRYYQKSEMDTALAGKTTESYVDARIAAVVGAAPTALDTLQEIAAQLALDESAVAALTTAVAGKANASHSHAISDTTGLQAALDAKQGSITAGAAISNAATNAPQDAKTDYGVLAAILGADVNATNGKQNTTAANVNALATKFNTLLATLRTQGIITT